MKNEITINNIDIFEEQNLFTLNISDNVEPLSCNLCESNAGSGFMYI